MAPWGRLIVPLDEGNFSVPGLLAELEKIGDTGPICRQAFGVKIPVPENLERPIRLWRRPQGVAASVGERTVRAGRFAHAHRHGGKVAASVSERTGVARGRFAHGLKEAAMILGTDGGGLASGAGPGQSDRRTRPGSTWKEAVA